MADLVIVTDQIFPEYMLGAHTGFSLRPLSTAERISIEDYLFNEGEKVSVADDAQAVVIPDAPSGAIGLINHALVAEFSLALLATSGHPSFQLVTKFEREACSFARLQLANRDNFPRAKFVNSLKNDATAQWLSRCYSAKGNLKDRVHVTANRYVRFARSNDLQDSLLDLCISLESLIDSQTEVSFRFGVCLAKITRAKGPESEEKANLLSQLYDLRSRIVHGDPRSTVMLKKIAPQMPYLRRLAREILTIYLLYMSEHSYEEWKAHVKASLFV